MNQLQIKISDIAIKSNVRSRFNEETLASLKDSIAVHGILQPILVRESAKGKYELVSGHRRFKCATELKLGFVPAMVRDIPDDEVTQIQLIENLQREDLNPIDEAESYILLGENVMDKDLVAMTGKSLYRIKKVKALLNLSDEIKELIRANKLSAEHGHVIARVKDHKVQVRIVKDVKKKGLTPFQTEAILSDYSDSLSNENFDKTECKTCAYNTKTITDLFDDDNFYDSKCLNQSCLLAKKAKALSALIKKFEAEGIKVKKMKKGETIYDALGKDEVSLDTYEYSEVFKKKAFNEECKTTCPSFRIFIDEHNRTYPICLNSSCAKRKKRSLNAIKGKSGKAITSETAREDVRKENRSRKKEVRVDKFTRKFYLSELETQMKKVQVLRIAAHKLMSDLSYDGTELAYYFGKDNKQNSSYSLKNIQQLKEKELIDFIQYLVIGRLAEYDTKEIASLAGEVGIFAKESFNITREYLEALDKAGLMSLAVEANLAFIDDSYKKLKKGELIDAMIELGLENCIPKEIK